MLRAVISIKDLRLIERVSKVYLNPFLFPNDTNKIFLLTLLYHYLFTSDTGASINIL